MDNFNLDKYGYNKKEVNDFVDYVIKKTEENVNIIRSQSEEIKRLNEELRLNKNMYYMTKEEVDNIKRSAEIERDRIINDAKDNASRIVNDALIRANATNKKQELLNKNIYIYKKKIRNTLMEQLEALDDIEML